MLGCPLKADQMIVTFITPESQDVHIESLPLYLAHLESNMEGRPSSVQGSGLGTGEAEMEGTSMPCRAFMLP